jgi:sugar/nucleoside kinase (ribokinase family)
MYTYSGGNYLSVPYLDIKKVDSTGSEAAFNGAFLSFMLQGYDLNTCLKYANCLISLQIQHIGAARSIPNLDEVTQLYKEKYE